MRFTKKDFNIDYLSKTTTTIINGFFVIMILFKHFRGQMDTTNPLDMICYRLFTYIDQLVVATFLFYSGYGIFESIKTKRDYVKNFFNNRFFPLWLNYAIANTIFLILQLLKQQNLSVSTILLSYTGFESLGIDTWYIFDTFLLYFYVIICFKQKKNYICQIVSFWILTILTILIMQRLKSYHFVNTLLCFPFGIVFSFFKNKLEAFFKNKYYLKLFITICIFVGLFLFLKLLKIENNFAHNMLAISFVTCIVVASTKIVFNNNVFEFFGKHVFWIYVLQRIPVMCLKYLISNRYILFILSSTITIVSAYWMNKLSKLFFTKKSENALK
jgi:hypothetical protein